MLLNNIFNYYDLTDDSSAERNALELCWPQGNIPIFVFFIFSMYFFYVIG